MKKNKFSEESKNVLSLGELQVELQKKKSQNKVKIIPIILIFIGIILILSGVFFEDIKRVLNIDQEKKEEKKNEDDGIIVLTCEYKKSDTTIGLTKKNIIKYEFKDKLLKKVTTTMTMTIIENSYDIGSNNIKIYYQRYNDSLKDIKLDGLNIVTTYKNEVLKNTVDVNLEVLDVTKVPQNSYVNISNRKDQSYREIKEIEGRAGHICKTS